MSAVFAAIQPILHQKQYESALSFYDKNNELVSQVVHDLKWNKDATTKVELFKHHLTRKGYRFS